MLHADEIKGWIQAEMPDAQIELSGDGHHFDAVIVSPEFEGKNTLARQRMVYATLGDKMGTVIHALSMKTLTPMEAK